MGLEEHLRNGWRFAADAQRVLMWSLAYVGFGVLALAPLVLVAGSLARLLTPAGILGALGLMLWWILLFFLFLLADVYLTGLFIHAAGENLGKRRVELRASATAAWRRFPSLMGAWLVMGAAHLVVSMFSTLDAVGFAALWDLLQGLARLGLSLAFFFVNYEIMLGGRGAVESVRESALLFRREPLRVVLLAFVLAFAAIIVFAAALVPVLAAGLFSLPLLTGGFDLPRLALAVVLLVVALAILLAAVVFTELLVIGTLASAFREMDRKPVLRARARPPRRRK